VRSGGSTSTISRREERVVGEEEGIVGSKYHIPPVHGGAIDTKHGAYITRRNLINLLQMVTTIEEIITTEK